MKTLFIISIFAVSGLLHPTIAQGDFSNDTEKEFEVEIERNDLGDLKDESAVAEDEAQHQEQLARQHQEEMAQLQHEKAVIGKKAKTMIAGAAYRIKKAEKVNALYESQISHLQKQIAALKEDMAQFQSQAEDAEGLAAEERVELKHFREERKDLLKRIHQKRSPATTKKSTGKDDLDAYHDALQSGDEF
jgi:chromosome segregation ATPase